MQFRDSSCAYAPVPVLQVLPLEMLFIRHLTRHNHELCSISSCGFIRPCGRAAGTSDAVILLFPSEALPLCPAARTARIRAE